MGAVYDFTRYRFFISTAQRTDDRHQPPLRDGWLLLRHPHRAAGQPVGAAAPGLFLFLNGQWNDIKLPEGNFKTTLYRFTGETQFSPFMSLVNNIQYDSQSAVLGWQSRFRWILTPGNDLYLVYTHNWLDDPLLSRFATLDKRFASKILYTYRF